MSLGGLPAGLGSSIADALSAMSGAPTRVLGQQAYFPSSPQQLMSNPGGMAALPGQIYPYSATQRLGQNLPESLMGGRGLFRDLSAVPESNNRVNARTRINRTCVVTRLKFSTGEHVEFGAPVKKELSFVLRDGLSIGQKPRFRDDVIGMVERLKQSQKEVFKQRQHAHKTVRDLAAQQAFGMMPMNMAQYHTIAPLTMGQFNYWQTNEEGALLRRLDKGDPGDLAIYYTSKFADGEDLLAIVEQVALDGLVIESIDREHPPELRPGQQMTVMTKGAEVYMCAYPESCIRPNAHLWLIAARAEVDYENQDHTQYRFASPEKSLEEGGADFGLKPLCTPVKHTIGYPVQLYVVATPDHVLPEAYHTYTMPRLAGASAVLREQDFPARYKYLGRIQQTLDENYHGKETKLPTEIDTLHPPICRDEWEVRERRSPIQVHLAPNL